MRGCLTPPLAAVPITVEVTDEGGRSRLFHTVTDADGCYDLKRERVQLPPGKHRVQVFVTAGGDAAESVTSSVTVTIYP